MFDVIWTDPDRELVGEHRAKKELKREQKEKQQKRGSLSTARSSRSSGDSPFSLLRSHGLKRINTSEANGSVKSTVSSRLASPSESSTRSPLSPTFDLRSCPNSDIAATRTSFDPSSLDAPSEIEYTASSSPRGDRISPGLSRHGKYAESEGESPKSGNKRLARERWRKLPAALAIQSQRAIISDSDKQGHGSNSYATEGAASGDFADAVTTELNPSKTALQEQHIIQESLPSTSSPISTATPLPLMPSKYRQPPKLNDPPPQDWKRFLSENKSTKTDTRISKDSSIAGALPPLTFETQSGAEAWRHHIEHMATLSFEKLLSDFANLSFLQPCLATHETELKLKLMMLWSSNHIDPIIGGTRAIPYPPSTSKEFKVSHLALYESQETAAYLAASFPDYQVLHLSSSPLSAEFAPNLQALLVPHMNVEHIPRDPETFEIVSTLRMSSLLPISDIPTALERIANCLRPRGTLQLTLVDPLPRVATIGPSMARWLRKYLLSNLEKTSRCTTPRKHFAQWLAIAGLRGQGSTITTTKFFAISTCVSRKRDRLEEESGQPLDSIYQEKSIKAEIRSHIGRLLWKEVWGPFVTAPVWWWEDPACVEECVELGTIWEYYTIESRKAR